MKRIIVMFLAAIMLSTIVSGRPVTADGTVPVEKYDALVQENLELKRLLELNRKSEEVRVEVVRERAWNQAIAFYAKWAEGLAGKFQDSAKKSAAEYEFLVGRIEDSFLSGQKLNTGKTLRPVIFLPADIKMPVDIEQHKPALGRAIKFNQVWFQNQLGETFSLGELIVFRGRQGSAWYDALSPAGRASAIYGEIAGNGIGNDDYVVFMYGMNDLMSYGSSDYRVALINDLEIRKLLSGGVNRYNAMAVVAHEIGHMFGLRHSVADDKSAIMRVDGNGILVALNVFPLATFSEQEKNILRSTIRKE